MDEKICFLTEDPVKHPKGKGAWWELHYAPEEFYEKFPDSSLFYTSVTKETCREIEDLKKGDKIIVNTLNQRVINVKSFIDPLNGLYILEDKG